MSKTTSAGGRNAGTTKGARLKGRARRAAADTVGEATRQAIVDEAISTELAPAAAIAVLARSEQAGATTAPALECLAAGVTAADDEDKVRVQLMFPNGDVLPVEMTRKAGEALTNGLTAELNRSAGSATTG